MSRRPKPTVLPAGANFVPLQLLFSPAAQHDPDPDKGGPCHLCTASCCRYFALQLDKPQNKTDHDHIRWYLMHEGIAVWVQDGDWYLEVRTTCRHLQPDNRCGIYETRPQICRDYGLPGDDPCEYFTQDLEYDLIFENDAEYVAWLDKKKKAKKKKKKAKK